MAVHLGWRHYLLAGSLLVLLCATAAGQDAPGPEDAPQPAPQPSSSEPENPSTPAPDPWSDSHDLFPWVQPTTVPRRTKQDDNDSPSPAPVPARTQVAPHPVARLYEEAIPGVVRLVVKHEDGVGYGSGFVIGRKGFIVTSYHVIEGASRGVVTFCDGQNRLIVGVLGYDTRQDLALIKVDPGEMTLQPMTLSMTPPAAKTKVLAVGDPQGFFGTLTLGAISGTYKGDRVAADYRKLREDMVADPETEWVLSSAKVSAGNSGGPLMTSDGKVVGVNVWTWSADVEVGPEVSFAASARKVMELIGKAELKPQPLKDVATKEFGKLPTQKMVEAKRSARTGFDFAQDWRSGKPQPRTKVSQSIARAQDGIRCRRCSATGTIEVEEIRDEGSSPLLGNRKRHVTRVVTCPECSGAGIQVTELSYVRLLQMTESVMNINSRPMTDESLARTREAAREVFKKVVGTKNLSRADCVGAPTQALNWDKPTVGKPVVFYGFLTATFGKAGKTIALMRTHDTGKTVIILLPEGSEAPSHTWHLVGGLTVGMVTIRSDQGVHRHRGVEAFAVEPAP